MKIAEKCKVIVASSLVAALMTGTALPALAASPAGDVPFAVLAQQNRAVTPEQPDRYCHAQQTRGNRGRSGCL